MTRSLVGMVAMMCVCFLLGPAAADAPTAATLDVFAGPKLSPGFAMGVNTSGGKTDWVTVEPGGVLDCAYPAGQTWGAVFITVGKLEAVVDRRTTKDLSSCHTLSVDLKGKAGGEGVSIGIKTDDDPDNGAEPKYVVHNLATDWKTFKIPISTFTDTVYNGAKRLTHIYVAFELVFESSNPSETIYCRNIRYEP